MSAAVRRAWSRWGDLALGVAVALMGLAAALKLGVELSKLVLGTEHVDALDLMLRHADVQRWFSGGQIYRWDIMVQYPPASYVLLWPLLGWLPLESSRWLWAATALAALVWLTVLLLRESGARTPLQRGFAALLLPSANATGAAIGVGQSTLHLLAPLAAGLLLVCRGRVSWRRDLLGAALLVLALIKPSLTVPFFWIVLFVPGRLRPIALVVAGYLTLTVAAAAFRQASPLVLVQDWIANSAASSDLDRGYADLYWLLYVGGQPGWRLPASSLLLGLFGAWVYWARRADLWLLIGVAALVARFWIYHRFHDDALIVLPMLTLSRIARAGPLPGERDLLAAALLGLTLVVMLLPGRLLQMPEPWGTLAGLAHAVVWLAVLVFLLDEARRSLSRPRLAPAALASG